MTALKCIIHTLLFEINFKPKDVHYYWTKVSPCNRQKDRSNAAYILQRIPAIFTRSSVHFVPTMINFTFQQNLHGLAMLQSHYTYLHEIGLSRSKHVSAIEFKLIRPFSSLFPLDKCTEILSKLIGRAIKNCYLCGGDAILGYESTLSVFAISITGNSVPWLWIRQENETDCFK